MKFTLSWLKRHLDTNASLDDICAKLTAIGLEVENVEDKAKLYAPFKVAYVESAEKHPDADKLKLCKVKTEKGIIQVVCAECAYGHERYFRAGRFGHSEHGRRA